VFLQAGFDDALVTMIDLANKRIVPTGYHIPEMSSKSTPIALFFIRRISRRKILLICDLCFRSKQRSRAGGRNDRNPGPVLFARDSSSQVNRIDVARETSLLEKLVDF